MSSNLGLTRAKIRKLAKLITEYPQQEAAALAGIPPRSYSRYKSLGRQVFDAIIDEEITEEELDEKEKLFLEFFVAVDMGVPKHVGKYYKIMRDTAHGDKVILTKTGEKKYTDWVAAKEYAHMLTFATKEARDEREEAAQDQQETDELGVIQMPSGLANHVEAFMKQQADVTKNVQEKRKDNGDE